GWVDVDGDGDLDLDTIAARPGLWLNDGAGNLSPGPEVPASRYRVESVVWADYDQDGDADGVVRHWRDPGELLKNAGGGHFTLVPLPVVAEGAVWQDLDRDG